MPGLAVKYFANSEKSDTFAIPTTKGHPFTAEFQSRTPARQKNQQPARMAESVDALVSNTSGAIRAGSIPAPGTQKGLSDALSPFCVPSS